MDRVSRTAEAQYFRRSMDLNDTASFRGHLTTLKRVTDARPKANLNQGFFKALGRLASTERELLCSTVSGSHDAEAR